VNHAIAVPDNYEFVAEEVVDLDERGEHYMPYIDWESTYDREREDANFVLILATMGSGKTHQLKRLLAGALAAELSVICVTHQKMVARQIASLFEVPCYDQVEDDLYTYPSLVCCLHLLYKIGNRRKYDIVIFDEFGLNRRSFLASMMRNVLQPVLQTMRRVILDARAVVLSQDELSRDDVGFFSIPKDVDPEDRNYVRAMQFKKQVKHYPIVFTTDTKVDLHHLIMEYTNGFSDDAIFTHPFIVYCSCVKTSEFLTSALRLLAPNDDAKGHIKGIWRSIKFSSDDFCERFASDPNNCAQEVDVLVCTSIIGAGFCITTHLVEFHAFFTANVLTHTEEKQFLFRLRYAEEMVLPRSCSSYILCENGTLCSSQQRRPICLNRNDLRTSMMEVLHEVESKVGPSYRRDLLLTNAEVDVKSKVVLTRCRHASLMEEFCETFSTTVMQNEPLTELQQNKIVLLQQQISQKCKKMCKSIVQFLIEEKPLDPNQVMQDNDRFEHEDEMFHLYQFLFGNVKNVVT
jgi:hypothetical protein